MAGECGPERYGKREVLTAALDVDGSPFNLVAVHPDSPRTPCRWQSRQDYYAALAGVIAGLPASEPAVIIGDWNTSPFPATSVICFHTRVSGCGSLLSCR